MSEKKYNPKPTLDDFWAFRTMILPWLIQIIFWIGSIGCIVVGFQMLAAARAENHLDSLEILHGIGCMILGPLLVRLACEVLIVPFRINETLTEIKNKM